MGQHDLSHYDPMVQRIIGLPVTHRRQLIGRILRRARYRLGLSAEDAASLLGRHQQKLTEWELGEVPIPAGVLLTLHRNYGLRNRELYALILLQYPEAFFLATSILGITGLWIAILADTGATVLVTLNALRLLRFDPDRR